MNYSTYRFTLDLQKHESTVTIAVFQYDSAVKFHISLTDGGKPYLIEEGCYAIFNGKRADDLALCHDCSIPSNTEIMYEFNDTTAATLGTIKSQICLYGKDGRLISAPRFTIVVEPRVVSEDDIEITDSEKEAIDNLFLSEFAREEAEAARVIAENKRVKAEQSRDSQETERHEAEIWRLKIDVERADAESARVVAEKKREANDSIRGENDLARDEAEKKRASAELERQSNENQRASDELSRQDAELIRATTEQERIINEGNRVIAEQKRVTAEEGRASFEVLRDGNESIRIQSENSRIESENARRAAEAARVEAENNRQNTLNEAVDTAEQAYETANNTSSQLSSLSKELHDFINYSESPEGFSGLISDHNADKTSHSDIREELQKFKTEVDALLDSDDTTLDSLQEIVTYIKTNKNLIDSITTDKVNVSDIVDKLTSTAKNKPLSANQGFALKSLINNLSIELENHITAYNGKVSDFNTEVEAIANDLSTHKKAYNTKMIELVAADKTNADNLTNHKSDYNTKIAALEAADKTNADNLANHKTDYNAKVSALEAADQTNATNLTKHKNAYNAKISELVAADTANSQALTEHKQAYNTKITALESADSTNTAALNEHKQAYNTKIAELEEVDTANSQALTDHKNAYNSKITALEKADLANSQALALHKQAYNSKIAEIEEAVDGTLAKVGDSITEGNFVSLDPDTNTLVDTGANKDTYIPMNFKTSDRYCKIPVVGNTEAAKVFYLQLTPSEAFPGGIPRRDSKDGSIIAPSSQKTGNYYVSEKHVADNYVKNSAYNSHVGNYNSKIAALESADSANTTALNEHKQAYNSKIAELEAADTANSQAISNNKTAAENALSTHNTSTTAHNDIRTKLEEFNTKINTLLDTNDEDLASLQEVVDYIKDNKDLIDEISTNKVNVSDIIDDLVTSDSKKPLSANQGVVLKGLIDTLTNNLNTHKTTYNTKVAALEAADEANSKALENHKTAYNAKIAELEDEDEDILENLNSLKNAYNRDVADLEEADKTNANNLANHKSAYNTKIAALEAADTANSQALTEHKNAYNSKIAELVSADSANSQALATHKAAYNEKVAELVEADSANSQALETHKQAYNTKIAELVSADSANTAALNEHKQAYNAKIAEIEEAVDGTLAKVGTSIPKDNFVSLDPDTNTLVDTGVNKDTYIPMNFKTSDRYCKIPVVGNTEAAKVFYLQLTPSEAFPGGIPRRDSKDGSIIAPSSQKTGNYYVSEKHVADNYVKNSVYNSHVDQYKVAAKAISDEIIRATAKETALENAIKLLSDGAGTTEIDSVKELIQYVNDHGTTTEQIQKDIKANTTDIADHEKRISANSTLITGYYETIGMFDSRLTDVENGVTGGNNTIGEIQAELGQHDVSIYSLQSGLSNHVSEFLEHKKLHIALDQKIASIETTLAKLTYVDIIINRFYVSSAILTRTDSVTGEEVKETISNISKASTLTYEKGQTVSDIVFYWETSKTPTNLFIDTVGELTIGENATSGEYTLVDDNDDPKSIEKSSYWMLWVLGEGGESPSRKAYINFYTPVYYGASSSTSITDSLILGLSGYELTDSNLSDFSVTAADGEYIYYCTPYGECSFKDIDTGLGYAFDPVQTIEFTNASGYTTTYYVYRSTKAIPGTANISVSSV